MQDILIELPESVTLNATTTDTQKMHDYYQRVNK